LNGGEGIPALLIGQFFHDIWAELDLINEKVPLHQWPISEIEGVTGIKYSKI